MHDKFLARIYEEKGLICELMAEDDADYQLRAL